MSYFIVKFTRSKYKKQVLEGGNIRIGSIQYYREIEDERFRDEDEGIGRVHFVSRQPLTADQHNRIFKFEGYRLNKDWRVFTERVPLISEMSPYNCSVFCCSLLRSLDDVDRLMDYFEYDSYYFINNVWEFTNHISVALKEYLLAEVKKEREIASFSLDRIVDLNVYPVIGLVKYLDEPKKVIVNEENQDSFDPQTIDIPQIFSKPARFSTEQEFRFSWYLNFGDIYKQEFDFISWTRRYCDLQSKPGVLNPTPYALRRDQICSLSGEPLV